MSRLPFGTWPKGRPAPAEPTWFPGGRHPPTYYLRAWSETGGWMTLGWIDGGRNAAGIAAALLRVGTGGPYAIDEV
ncbi:hypothetical protein [Streptomyces sp. ITFR-6]|uniref:hypothetical protein n=1 Tax=Streptomyces sp. ITFR-6 TaxID=3075197 RepID=UPI00288BA6E5|nr:hypothetical protein [Streptomyces sp. ITFR-6]WNI28434.1 hypothetical protein RLT59_06320 [Streptomyces sp. ITFR-6]